MAKGFNSEFLEELKSRTDIVRVVQKYLPLEKKGRNHWGRCPFHHEKTPSFAVNGESQFYHCFGCSASGDAIKFVREMESVDFIEAVKLLCQDAGMQMPEPSKNHTEIQQEKRMKDRLLALMRDAANFYYRCLSSPAGAEAQRYLDARGVDAVTRKTFGLGFSPDFQSVVSHLLQKGYTPAELKASGVANDKNDRLIDNLGGRLIFPIQDAFGSVIAFGGRSLVKTDFAKYKNTQETKLFSKSRVLYAQHLLKAFKQEKGIDSCIVVEGYMDTIALHKAGFRNTVASMGTALTKEQARALKRYSGSVYICYDGDSAGQKATLRGLDVLSTEGITVRVVSLPEGVDPDDLIASGGPAAFDKCLSAAMPLVDFKLHSLSKQYDVNTTEGRRKYTAEALMVVAEITNSTEQEDCLKLLRDQTGFTLESLKRDLERLMSQSQAAAIPVMPVDNINASSPDLRAVRAMLCCMLNGLVGLDDLAMLETRITESAHRGIANYLRECRAKGTRPVPSMAYEYVEEGGEAEVSGVLGTAEAFSGDGELKQYYSDSVKRFKIADTEEKIAALTTRFTEETDISERKKLTLSLMELTQEFKRLKES